MLPAAMLRVGRRGAGVFEGSGGRRSAFFGRHRLVPEKEAVAASDRVGVKVAFSFAARPPGRGVTLRAASANPSMAGRRDSGFGHGFGQGFGELQFAAACNLLVRLAGWVYVDQRTRNGRMAPRAPQHAARRVKQHARPSGVCFAGPRRWLTPARPWPR